MGINLILVILITILATFVFYRHGYSMLTFADLTNSTKVCTKVDGNCYYVNKGHRDKNVSANTIGEINVKIHRLIMHLKTNFRNDPRTVRLIERYDDSNIIEGTPFSKFSSYTINKGEQLVLCIRNLESKIHDINILMFVTLHEIGHYCSESYGHNDEFWYNFTWILNRAVEIGIYDPEDYNKKNKQYCNMIIKSNPYYSKYNKELHD